MPRLQKVLLCEIRDGYARLKTRLSGVGVCDFLLTTNLKGVSSMKLHRDLGITQKSAWHLAQRLRKEWQSGKTLFDGPVEVDETYIGGKEKNKKPSKKLKAGRGAVGKTAIIGAKDRATGKVDAAVVDNTKTETMHGFIENAAAKDAVVYTDDHRSYQGLPFEHETVKHLSRYVVEFAGRYNLRPLDTKEQMRHIANELSGQRLRYRDLVA